MVEKNYKIGQNRLKLAISVVRDIADRFWGWQQLIANDIPLLTAVAFARGP